MKSNVHDQLAAEKPSLVQRMAQNRFVADTIMGYLNLFIGLSLQQGFPVDGVRISPLVWCEGDMFRASVTFSRLSTAMPKLLGTQSDFFRYAGAKAAHMAKAIHANPTFEPFFADMVEVIGQWAKQKGCGFGDVEIENPVITRDHVLTFKVKRVVSLAFA